MSIFDHLHPRAASGVFVDKQQSAPEAIELIPSDLIGRLPEPGRKCGGLDSWHQANRDQYAQNLAAFDASPTGATDLFVGSVIDGHLSRGTPGKLGVAALRSWRIQARLMESSTGDVRYGEFADGLESAVVTLMFADPHIAPGDSMERLAQSAENLALLKRARTAERENWRLALAHAGSDSEWRGMLVAGAALAGTDSWWGFRADPDRTMLGTL
jgi:hypothetical protein